MPNQMIPAWCTEIAEKVRDWVRDDFALKRFQWMLDEFQSEKAQEEARRRAWVQRRKEYCERGLKTLDDFKARTAESERLGNDRDAIERTRPPEDLDRNFAHDYYATVLSPQELQRLGVDANVGMFAGFGAWVPPELCFSAAPKLTVPRLFARFLGDLFLHEGEFGTSIEPGTASWAEKYATLAAIHDARFPDRLPIDEMIEVKNSWGGDYLEQKARESLRVKVSTLPAESEASIRGWLIDVNSDLSEYMNSLDRLNQTAREPRCETPPDAQSQQVATSLQASRMRWLDRIADCVHEDTRDYRKKEHYGEVILAWADRTAREGRWKGIQLERYLRQEHPDWKDDEIEREVREAERKYGRIPMEFRHDSIAITTHRATPLDKKYATLAAIHDALNHCDYPLSPWKGEPFKNPFQEDATDQDAEDFTAWNFYRFLREDVTNLTGDDRKGIEQFLEEVSADLVRFLNDQDVDEPVDVHAPHSQEKAEMEKPTWERLQLIPSVDGSDHTAILCGTRIPIKGASALKFLQLLKEKAGVRIKGTLLRHAIGQSPNKVYRLLPVPLQSIVERPGQGGKGYAMREVLNVEPQEKSRSTKRLTNSAKRKSIPKVRKNNRQG